MTETYDELGGRPHPVEPEPPPPPKPKPTPRPLCGQCVNGWLEHPETHYPTRRCECRENN